MNIFVLDFDTEVCARYHCDKHVVKMIVEYAQLLSTAHHVLDGDNSKFTNTIYKKLIKIIHVQYGLENLVKIINGSIIYSHIC